MGHTSVTDYIPISHLLRRMNRGCRSPRWPAATTPRAVNIAYRQFNTTAVSSVASCKHHLRTDASHLKELVHCSSRFESYWFLSRGTKTGCRRRLHVCSQIHVWCSREKLSLSRVAMPRFKLFKVLDVNIFELNPHWLASVKLQCKHAVS